MDELFRLKIVSKRQLTVPQRLMDILGLSQGDELQFGVSDGRLVSVRPYQVTPDDQVSAEATAVMDKGQAAFDRGEFEVTDLETLLGSQPPHAQSAPLQEAERATREPRIEPRIEPRPARGHRWKWWYPQPAPAYASLVNRFHPLQGQFDPTEDTPARVLPGNVRMRITPRKFRRDDDKIYDSVGEVLSGAGLDVRDVEIEVVGGTVKLSGSVPELEQRLTADYLASNVLGVRNVENRIRVQVFDAANPSAAPAEQSFSSAPRTKMPKRTRQRS